MAYETVTRLKDTIKDDAGNFYLRGCTGEKFSLLYFLRESHFRGFPDWPCRGGYEERLGISEVKGPFESKPVIQPQKAGDKHRNQLLEVFFPVDQVPARFFPVSLLEYGLREEVGLRPRDYYSMGIDGINSSVANRIQELDQAKELENGLLAKLYGCTVHFVTSPLPQLRVFGEQERASAALEELWPRGNGWIEYSDDREIAVLDTTRKGLIHQVPEALNGLLHIPGFIF